MQMRAAGCGLSGLIKLFTVCLSDYITATNLSGHIRVTKKNIINFKTKLIVAWERPFRGRETTAGKTSATIKMIIIIITIIITLLAKKI